MKKVLSILAITLLFFSCGQAVKHNNHVENSREYDNLEELREKTFTNYNSDYDILLKESFYFTSTGSVHFIEKVEGFPAESIEIVYKDFKHIKKEEDYRKAESMRLDSLERIKEAEDYKKSREKI